MKKEITLKLEDGNAVVRRLQLQDLGTALKKFNKISSILTEFEGKSNEEAFENLPLTIAENFEDLADVIVIPTDLKRKELLELDLADSLAVVNGILEVNRFDEIKHFLVLIRSKMQKAKAPKKVKA